jgi:predicted  nucleic acid-binding Zn-ribbon protein
VDADPSVQLRLLDLQALDSGIDRLTLRRRTLPESAAIEQLSGQLRDLAADLSSAESARDDTTRAQARLETDVENVRARAARDQSRLDSGAISSARELENLQAEIASLHRRRDTLEDELLELMEAAEEATTRARDLADQRDGAEAERTKLTRQRDAEWERIDAELVRERQARDVLAAELPSDLVALYERLRASSDGVGAARLYRHRCEGCHLELSGADLREVAEAPPTLVLRCEECRRILVRTEESGL